MFGRPVRLLLRAAVDRDGRSALLPVARLSARLTVTADHWHTTRAVRRGAYLDAADVRAARHELTGGAFALPPNEAEVVGAAALRDLPADACVTARMVLPQPAVKAGEAVAAIVRLGMVEARAALVAIDGGRIGATVRVRHPETKRTLSATIVGRGQVEVQR
jgi:flagella basal body P-ring formation protein FlgA